MRVRIRAENPDSGLKVINVESFEELVDKGCEKLNLSRDEVELRTLDSGIDIEDDEGVACASEEKSVVVFKRNVKSTQLTINNKAIESIVRICVDDTVGAKIFVVKAENFKELIQAGCSKLNLSSDKVKLVTLKEGIDVEDDDDFRDVIKEKATIVFKRINSSTTNTVQEVKTSSFEEKQRFFDNYNATTKHPKTSSSVLNPTATKVENEFSHSRLTKLRNIFEEKMDFADQFQKTVTDFKKKHSTDLFPEELKLFEKEVDEFSNEMSSILDSFTSAFKKESQNMSSTNDVESQFEILSEFKSIGNYFKSNIDGLQIKLNNIASKFACSPQGNLTRKVRLMSVANDGELESKNQLKLYKLPMEETHVFEKDKLKSFELGEVDTTMKHYYILLTGMTGVGKSLFVNNMINYIFGVRFEDNFRLKLIIEADEIKDRPKEASQSQAESMTSWVTCYTFHYQEGFRIPFSLTIVDTPGFGDTRGVAYDQKIVDQIKKLFTNLEICPTQEISSIGFLIQASQARITAEQTYIFNQVLNIFARDMENNIFLIFTFADAQDPPALATVKENKIPFAEGCTFKFNNSAVYAPNTDKSSKYSWNFGFESLKTYFQALEKREPVSLRLTNEVLNERSDLFDILEGLKWKIQEGMAKLESIENEYKALEELERNVDKHKNHTTSLKVTKWLRRLTSENYNNCKSCERTCHPISGWERFSVWVCSLFSTPKCEICKCSMDRHVTENAKIESNEIEEKVTQEDIYKKYNLAVDSKNAKKTLLKKMLQDYKNGKKALLESIEKANKCANRLDKIALRNSCLSNSDFIDNMIRTEQKSSNANKTQRLDQLRHMKEMAEILEKARQNPKEVSGNMSDYETMLMKKIQSIKDE